MAKNAIISQREERIPFMGRSPLKRSDAMLQDSFDVLCAVRNREYVDAIIQREIINEVIPKPSHPPRPHACQSWALVFLQAPHAGRPGEVLQRRLDRIDEPDRDGFALLQ